MCQVTPGGGGLISSVEGVQGRGDTGVVQDQAGTDYTGQQQHSSSVVTTDDQEKWESC